MPWLLNEDEAVKKKFQGLTVRDSTSPTSGRPVTVRWRLPETELADATFPMIVLEHLGPSVAHDREHRGYTNLPYAPEGLTPLSDASDPRTSPYWAEFPIPYNLDYQVSTYCRKATQDIELRGKLANENYIHPRDGFLIVPQDSTIRRLDLIGGPEPVAEKDSDGKRIFRSIYTIRISSELLPSEIDTYQEALSVGLRITDSLNEYAS
jgi:hypothetical protein